MVESRSRASRPPYQKSVSSVQNSREHEHAPFSFSDFPYTPPMRCLIGLGNPGAKYATSRHNCGFMVIDELARRRGADRWRSKWDAHVVEWNAEGVGAVLAVKPQTFMNRSGE